MQTAENPGFDEFKSQYWHSERKSNAIYGRAKGSYESVFGGTHKTSGRYSGKNLEGKRFGKIKIQPSPPSGAIKISEEMLMKQWLPIAYSNVKKKIKEIFIENKIPLSKRNNYPLLVDAKDNILWIPNIKKSNLCNKKEENYDIIIKYIEGDENNE